MSKLFRDTDLRAQAVLIEGLRRMTSAQKLARVAELRAAALHLARIRIRERGAAMSAEDELMELSSLWLDPHVWTCVRDRRSRG